MKITKIKELFLSRKENIQAATLSSPDELIMLLNSGDVIRYPIENQEARQLFSVKSHTGYADGGFNLQAPSQIYYLDDIVVLVNTYQRHGFVHYPGKFEALHLWRGDYHADISAYPIALFKSEAGIPHLIYGEDWNHLQIMNLASRQILTAAKSLIEVDAEEKHLEFYKRHEASNKLPWPRPLDYFFGRILMSPNQKYFLSAGWVWGSFDAYLIFDVAHFIENNRIAYQTIGSWEHSDRGVCWIDNERIALTYHPFEEEEEGAREDSPQEIHFYRITGQKSVITKKIQIVDLDILSSRIFFNPNLNLLVLLSPKLGILLLSLEGEVLFHEPALKPGEYYPDFNLFLETKAKSLAIYQIEK